MTTFYTITEEEAAQLVADQLVLGEAIGAGLLDDDTVARLQLGIDPEPWFRAHPAWTNEVDDD